MERKDWLQMLVGGIILGTLGWLSTQVFDIRGTLSKVETRVTVIADEMPGIGRYAAWREIEAPISGAVLASKPYLADDRRWKTTIYVTDLKAGSVDKYRLVLASKDDQTSIYPIIGCAVKGNETSASLNRYMYYSMKADKPVSIPGSIDQEASFIFKKGDINHIKTALLAVGGKPEAVTGTLKSKNWVELSSEISAKKGKLSFDK